ncbi:MAG: hypothetical protein QOE08_2467 [Thermoleophilaceae bacterium]|nr:hypothetical protein [Thermoleophilaceae bacterium]
MVAGIAAVAVALATGALAVLSVLVVVPAAAAAVLSAGATAAVGAAALAAALAGGLPHHAFGAVHAAAITGVALSAVTSTWIAARRSSSDRAAAFISYLSDASTLLSCSLDFDSTVKTVASLPVPELADWALVEVRAAPGGIERRAGSRPDPAAEELARALGTQGEPAGRAEEPRARLWPDLPRELLEELPRPGRDEPLDARSAMVVPVRTMDHRIGTMTLLGLGRRPRYGDTDMRRAQALALRCAVALENAQAYRAARAGEGRFTRRGGSGVSPGAS